MKHSAFPGLFFLLFFFAMLPARAYAAIQNTVIGPQNVLQIDTIQRDTDDESFDVFNYRISPRVEYTLYATDPDFAAVMNAEISRAKKNAKKLVDDYVQSAYDLFAEYENAEIIDFEYKLKKTYYTFSYLDNKEFTDPSQAVFHICLNSWECVSIRMIPHIVYELSVCSYWSDGSVTLNPYSEIDYTYSKRLGDIFAPDIGEDASVTALCDIVYEESLFSIAQGTSVGDYLTAFWSDVNSEGEGLSSYINKAYVEPCGGDLLETSFRKSGWYYEHLGNWTILKTVYSANGLQAAAFLSPGGNCWISYRGTAGHTDRMTDGKFASAGILDAQFDEALDFYKEVNAIIPKERIHLTGHSLGGGLAAYVSLFTGCETQAINGAIGLVFNALFTQEYNPSYAELYRSFRGLDGVDIRNRVTASVENSSGSLLNDLIALPYESSFYTIFVSPSAYAPAASLGTGLTGYHSVFSQLYFIPMNSSLWACDASYYGHVTATRFDILRSRFAIAGTKWWDRLILNENSLLRDAFYKSYSYYFGDGDGEAYGTGSTDTFYFGTGNQSACGFTGDDTYVITSGTGTFTIDDCSGETSVIFLDYDQKKSISVLSCAGSYSVSICLKDGGTVNIDAVLNSGDRILLCDVNKNVMEIIDPAQQSFSAGLSSAETSASRSLFSCAAAGTIICRSYNEEGNECGCITADENFIFFAAETGEFYRNGDELTVFPQQGYTYSFETESITDLSVISLRENDLPEIISYAEHCAVPEWSLIKTGEDGLSLHYLDPESGVVTPIDMVTLEEPVSIEIKDGLSAASSSADGSSVLEAGMSLQLEVMICPQNSFSGVLTWSSSDETVAEVNRAGLVIAKEPGQAVITATYATGNILTADYQITVTAETTGFLDVRPEDDRLYLLFNDNGMACSVYGAVYDENGRFLRLTHFEELIPGLYVSEADEGSDMKIISIDKNGIPICPSVLFSLKKRK